MKMRTLLAALAAALIAGGIVAHAPAARAEYAGVPLSQIKGGTGATSTPAWVDLTTNQGSIGGNKTLTGATTLSGGVTIGAGTACTLMVKYAVTWPTPAAVTANNTNTQTLTVTGLRSTDFLTVTSSALGIGIALGGSWCSADDTLSQVFSNSTTSSRTPTAGATYTITAWRIP